MPYWKLKSVQYSLSYKRFSNFHVLIDISGTRALTEKNQLNLKTSEPNLNNDTLEIKMG